MTQSTTYRNLDEIARTASNRMVRLPLWFVVANLILLAPTAGMAQNMGESASSESLGNVVFPISCASEVQSTFERGVALLHHMMYVEARKTFQGIADENPTCAMAHWGTAMTLFQPLWPTRPGPEELSAGWDAVTKAKNLNPATQREKDYIAAVEAFYQETDNSDYRGRIQRFEQGMAQVYQAYPEDREAGAFYALSLLATAPQSDDRPAQHAKAAEILLKINGEEPDHPGAVHYTIHNNDMDGRESESLEIVRSYDEIAPSVPHALHMPTHIFVRLGEWEDVIQWNNRSAIAALNFPAGDATSHHYLHALDYQVYAYLQRAEDTKAEDIVISLAHDMNFQKTFISAYALAAIPARYAIERRQWAEAASLGQPNPQTFPVERFPWPMSITEFARGLGAARSGDREVAEQAIARLLEHNDQAEEAGETYFAQQIEVSRMAVAAWLSHARGDNDEALQMMQASAELEASMEKHPVTPAAIQPAYELLGDLLAELDRPDEAMDAYMTSLKTWPGRFNTLLGAARAAAAAGDREQAISYYAELVQLAGEVGSERPALNEARSYLGDG